MLECGRHPQKGAAQDLKGWYKPLEDLVWLTQLGMNMLLGLAAGAQNFWVFCKERLERSKHEKNHRVGFNSHQ